MPPKEIIELLKELIDYDYNMGHGLYAVKKRRAAYLHDIEMSKQLDRDFKQLREWSEGL